MGCQYRPCSVCAIERYTCMSFWLSLPRALTELRKPSHQFQVMEFNPKIFKKKKKNILPADLWIHGRASTVDGTNRNKNGKQNDDEKKKSCVFMWLCAVQVDDVNSRIAHIKRDGERAQYLGK